jgi:hypothetical protein
MIPDRLSELMLENDNSVSPPRSSVFTGETKWEDGILWYLFIDTDGDIWAALSGDKLVVEEV